MYRLGHRLGADCSGILFQPLTRLPEVEDGTSRIDAYLSISFTLTGGKRRGDANDPWVNARMGFERVDQCATKRGRIAKFG